MVHDRRNREEVKVFTRQELVARALAWNDLGVGCIPLAYRDKNALVKWKVWVGRVPPKPLVEQWIRHKWQCNLGVLLGGIVEKKTLVVLDFDQVSVYVGWRAAHKSEAKSYTVKTRRGWHVYLLMSDAPDQTLKMIGGEVKATGYVVGEGSVHESGLVYTAVSGMEILSAESLESLHIEVVCPSVPERDIEIAPTSTDKTGGVVSRIKEAIGITAYLSRWTQLSKKADGTYVGICPFHRDSHPSLQVWPKEGRAYCHSPSCRAHRRCDVITCAEFAMGVSTQEAIRILAQELG